MTGEALAPGSYIEVTLDNTRVGSGRRCYLVLTVGRKWVALFYDATLTRIVVDRRLVLAGTPCLVDIRPSRIAGNIRARRAQYKRLNAEALARHGGDNRKPFSRPCPFVKNHVREALSLIETARAARRPAEPTQAALPLNP